MARTACSAAGRKRGELTAARPSRPVSGRHPFPGVAGPVASCEGELSTIGEFVNRERGRDYEHKDGPRIR